MIQVNDEVVCIDDSFPIDAYIEMDRLPIKGQSYIVEDIYEKEYVGLLLKGFNHINIYNKRKGFKISRFRKKIDELVYDNLEYVESS